MVIGLTIVSFGTSLPELTVNLLASFQGDSGIAIGNAVGSNIFNIFWILGISAVIKPLTFRVANNVDVLMIIGSWFLIYVAFVFSHKWTIQRWAGVLFPLSYRGYITYTVIRG